MTPYYDRDGITIYCADCRDVLPTLGPVDLVLTDPPYGIAYDASHKKYHNGIDRGDAAWDKEPFDPSHLLTFKRLILWGGNCFSSRLPDSTGWLCWVKTARDHANIRQSDMELAWTNCIRRPRVFHHLWIGAYRDSESGKRNVHPTQKPIALMKWCIRIAGEDEVILDPFMGSGTTLVAAKALGRKAIGIEISEKYCEIAVKRLAQGELFGIRDE